jgi:hypothetical protein
MVFSRAQVDDYNPLKRSVATRDVKRDQIVQLPYGRQTLPHRIMESLPACRQSSPSHKETQIPKTSRTVAKATPTDSDPIIMGSIGISAVLPAPQRHLLSGPKHHS